VFFCCVPHPVQVAQAVAGAVGMHPGHNVSPMPPATCRSVCFESVSLVGFLLSMASLLSNACASLRSDYLSVAVCTWPSHEVKWVARGPHNERHRCQRLQPVQLLTDCFAQLGSHELHDATTAQLSQLACNEHPAANVHPL
jgi:hypothetical protein